MIRFEVGTFAKSLAGHDKGEIYLIIKVDDEYVYLVNGKSKTEGNPKRKKRKHVQWINTHNEELSIKIQNAEKIHDYEIKRAIQLV